MAPHSSWWTGPHCGRMSSITCPRDTSPGSARLVSAHGVADARWPRRGRGSSADMLTDPRFADGRNGAVAGAVRAAFSVPVLNGDRAIASLACHYMEPHSPSAIDIERNEVFAKLIRIALRGREGTPIPEPY